MSLTIKPDTDIDSRLKIVQIDGSMHQLSEDMREVKGDVRAIFVRIDALSQVDVKFTQLVELVNTNSNRSDHRWEQHMADRREEMTDWKKWRESVDSYKTSVRILIASVVVGLGVITGIGNHYFTQAEIDRTNNTDLIKQNNIIQTTHVDKNTDRLRTIENFLSKNPDFKPGQ